MLSILNRADTYKKIVRLRFALNLTYIKGNLISTIVGRICSIRHLPISKYGGIAGLRCALKPAYN